MNNLLIKIFFLLLFISSSLFSQNNNLTGLRNVEYDGAYYNILGIGKSNDEKYLAISSYGGRFYLLNIENKKTTSALSQGEKLIWKKNISGFKNGAKPIFSSSGKYILLKHVYEKEFVTKYKPTACVVLETETGKIVYQKNDGIMSADFVSDNTLLIANDQELEWFDLTSSKTIKKIEMPQAEAIAVNKAGTRLAVSYIPTKSEFANLKSINNRKREIKIAKKNKRLIEFFSLPDMETISVVEDELDVVFRMKFIENDKYLTYLSRAKTRKNGLSKDDQKQESSESTLRAIHVMKIEVETGIIDRTFYYRTMYPNADFNLNENLFAISSSTIIQGSFMGIKNGIELYDYNVQDKLIAGIYTKFKLFKRFPSPSQFCFLNGNTNLYISIGHGLYYWNTTELPFHTFNQINADEEAVINIAKQQLDSLTYSDDFKKKLGDVKLSGIYNFDITLIKKGQVVTVFSVTDEATDIKSYNFLLEYIKKFKFEGVKIEKDKRIKFNYEFYFDE